MKKLNILIIGLAIGMITFAFSHTEEPDARLPVEKIKYEENVPVMEMEDEMVYGIASYYGEKWNGRTTANMEIYDHKLLTCASPVLPFNTIVEITNLANCKTIVVRVNDRGPFKMDKNGKVLRPLQPHPKRILDLTTKAFMSIGRYRFWIVEYRVQNYRVVRE